jgi:TonB family protein
MRKVLFSILVTLLMVFGFEAAAIAQGSNSVANDEKCAGRIYEPKEVTQHPKYGTRESPGLTPEALAHGVRGRVVLTAVLCRTGKITDIKVIEGLPFGMTERVIEAARQIKFEPAERNGHKVSEKTQLEYNFGYLGDRRPPAQEPIAGRLIERLEITGLRSRGSQEIMAHLKTRPGEPCRQEQVMADLQSLLALGFLDRKESRVRVEEGVRGGVNVVFELVELPPK